MREHSDELTRLLQRGADSELGEVGRGGVFTEKATKLARRDRRSLGGGYWTGTEEVFLALQDGFLATGPPGKL